MGGATYPAHSRKGDTVMGKSRMGRRYGWIRSWPDPRDHWYSAPAPCLQALPRRVDHTADFPDAYDQLQTNSCVWQSLGGIAEHCWKAQGLTVCTPSRLFGYYETRAMEGWLDSDGGCIIRDAIKVIARFGIPHEDLWPFDEANVFLRPPQAAYDDALTRQAVQYSRVPQALVQMRASLAQGVPWVVGLTLFEGFESDEAMRTGVINLPTTEELKAGTVGAHAVVAVGYDDDEQRFIMRNSWGRDWGQNGYFTIPYAYVQSDSLASDLWRITLMEQTP